VCIAASGVNFIDVYFRTGLYKRISPSRSAAEGAGTVEAVGAEVAEVAVGRPCSLTPWRGFLRRYAVVPAALLVKIPIAIDFQTAAAIMLSRV